MEEQALYRAILAAPHDDTPRLVYADWLDENAEAFPPAQARGERARAEFIRLQCKITRLGAPDGTGAVPPGASDADLARSRRLLFHHARKWRRAFPAGVSSAPFSRGFLRPTRAMRPLEFLDPVPATSSPSYWSYAMPVNSPARRYIPEEPFAECPLWDVHLFASDWQWDPGADRGQYEGALAEVGKSPQLERVGKLKLSFFQTSTVEFLRTGNFANVETLVLNSGPFPEVLEAITDNESFRSLRYIQFGADRWAWAPTFPATMRFFALAAKIREANYRHLPHGEMRPALRSILRTTPLVPVAPPPPWPTALPPVPTSAPPTHFTYPPSSATASDGNKFGAALGVLLAVFLVLVRIMGANNTPSTPSPSVPQIKVPEFKPIEYDPKQFEIPKYSPEVEALLKGIREGKKPADDEALKEFLPKVNRDAKGKDPPPEAPAPRPVERKDRAKE